MEMIVLLTEQQLRCLKTGKRIRGSLGLGRTSTGEMVIDFCQYRKNGAKPRNDQTLLTLPHGWIRKSAQRYKLRLSIPDNLGEYRVAELLKQEISEGCCFLRALGQIMDVA